MVESYDQERKKIRKVINQIALYSNGSYTVQDLHNMTMEQVKEIQECMQEKGELEKQAREQSNGTNRKTF